MLAISADIAYTRRQIQIACGIPAAGRFMTTSVSPVRIARTGDIFYVQYTKDFTISGDYGRMVAELIFYYLLNISHGRWAGDREASIPRVFTDLGGCILWQTRLSCRTRQGQVISLWLKKEPRSVSRLMRTPSQPTARSSAASRSRGDRRRTDRPPVRSVRPKPRESPD